MKSTKNFIRKNKDIVLLVCDSYETKQIPVEMTEKKDNLALFPVANIPLIEYILSSLYHQKLTNIIMVGKNISSVFEYVMTIEFINEMNVMSLICDGSNLGDILREIDETDYCGDDLLILYANHYTNYNLKNLFRKHKQNNYLMTLFLHENQSNNKVSYFYGTKDSEVVFYEKCINGKYSHKHIIDSLEEHKTIRYNFNLSSPSIAVISSDVFPLFTENFDFTSLGDLLEGLLAFNPYRHRIGCIDTTNRDCSEAFSCMNLEDSINYNREIVTLYDYYKFNEDVRSGRFEDISKYKQKVNGEVLNLIRVNGNFLFGIPEGYTYVPLENTVLGSNTKLEMYNRIKDSFIGNGCSISGNINKCIVWDDVNVTEDLSEHIIFSDGQVINYHYLEVECEEEEKEEKGSNFFDDVTDYLRSFVEISHTNDIDIDEIIKQVNLTRILWNASNHDLLEAFAIFLTDIIPVDDIEGSTINASIFFAVLDGHVDNPNEQEEFLEYMYDLVKEKEFEYKKEVLFRYGYLLIEDGVISKGAMKKYSKMIKKGLF